MKKKILRIALVAFALTFVIVPFRISFIAFGPLKGFYITMWLDALLFFIYTAVCLKKYSPEIKPHHIVLAIAVGSSVLELPGIIVGVIDRSIHALFVVEVLLRYVTILGVFLVFRSRRAAVKAVILTANVAVILFFLFVGDSYALNIKNFGNLTGKIEPMKIAGFAVQTGTGETVRLEDFEGRFLLLDCWNTYCGVCYRKFPTVQELYDRYKDTSQLEIAALHFRNSEKETHGTGSEILAEKGYTFPCLSVDDADEVMKEMGIKGFPTVLIFSPEGRQIFIGNIELAEKFLEKTLK